MKFQTLLGGLAAAVLINANPIERAAQTTSGATEVMTNDAPAVKPTAISNLFHATEDTLEMVSIMDEDQSVHYHLLGPAIEAARFDESSLPSESTAEESKPTKVLERRVPPYGPVGTFPKKLVFGPDGLPLLQPVTPVRYPSRWFPRIPWYVRGNRFNNVRPMPVNEAFNEHSWNGDHQIDRPETATKTVEQTSTATWQGITYTMTPLSPRPHKTHKPTETTSVEWVGITYTMTPLSPRPKKTHKPTEPTPREWYTITYTMVPERFAKTAKKAEPTKTTLDTAIEPTTAPELAEKRTWAKWYTITYTMVPERFAKTAKKEKATKTTLDTAIEPTAAPEFAE